MLSNVIWRLPRRIMRVVRIQADDHGHHVAWRLRIVALAFASSVMAPLVIVPMAAIYWVVLSTLVSPAVYAAVPDSKSAISNQLQNHASAYLAMHGKDPVHWQSWGEEAVQLSRKQNKLMFVSIGYFSCHWCHVMQRESYQNPEIAKLLNDNFIPIKVDRELHPALDAKLIEFVERTRGYSGWPLNVFITPEGYPLVGVVYLPPADFKKLIQNLSQRWDAEANNLVLMAQSASAAMSGTEKSLGAKFDPALGARYREGLVKATMALADEVEGGFGEGNKFPQAPQMLALLRAYTEKPDANVKKFLLLTLQQMANKGLRDQLRGGFYRYAVDPNWHIPHFEKMLYDNALLAELYIRAGTLLERGAFTQVGRDTLQFMLDAFSTPAGAMIASLSAIDDQGVEGGYYLWDEPTLKQTLTEDELKTVNIAWGMEHAPSLEAGHLPIQAVPIQEVAKRRQLSVRRVESLIRSAQSKLLHIQQTRNLPQDNKQLAAWNGLALRALCLGASLDNGAKFFAEAKKVRNYLVTTLWNGKRLLRAKSTSTDLGSAALEDYAYVASGLLAWAQLTRDPADYKVVKSIVNQAWRRFHTDNGWKLSENFLIEIGSTEAIVADGPMPSPSAVLIDVSLAIARYEKHPELKKKALEAINIAHDTLVSDPFWYATHIDVFARANP